MTYESEEMLRADLGEVTELGQIGLGTCQGEITHQDGLPNNTLSSSVVSLPELAQYFQNDSGEIANYCNLFNLTNISRASNYEGNNDIGTMIGNRKKKKKIETFVRHENLINIKCNDPVICLLYTSPSPRD